jgi:hypothetical protein
MPLSPEYKKYNSINIIQSAADKKAYYTKYNPAIDQQVNVNPMMHQGFYNMEIESAYTIANGSNNYPRENNILEIGFGFGYSAQKFIDMGVRSYTCIEINDELYTNALYWAELQGQLGMETQINIYNGDWRDIMPQLGGYGVHGVYYSMYDEVGDEKNLSNFMEMCSGVCTQGALCSVQGWPLFSNFNPVNYSVGNASDPPPSTVFDSVFTYQLYTALYNKGYFNVYYQYLNGVEWGPSPGRGDIILPPPIGFEPAP